MRGGGDEIAGRPEARVVHGAQRVDGRASPAGVLFRARAR